MRRCWVLGALWLACGISAASAQTPAERAQTARFVAALQNPDGGFPVQPGGPSTLNATNAALRVLKFTGGSVRDVPGCAAFIKRCFDEQTGGFASAPGEKPDVAATVVGLIANTELLVPTEGYTRRAIAFFHDHARTFEEIRLAVAGLEAVDTPSPDFPAWRRQIEAMRHPDGTWGEGPGRARATGAAAAALLRMKTPLEKKEAAVAAMRAGQNADGAWSETEGPADFPSSYRVMRCLFMLKERPDLDRVQAFLARHRNADGGYAAAPGKPSDTLSTYYGTIIGHWARQLAGEPALIETAGFQPLFDGKDLDGWEGDTKLWKARDGMIVGVSPGLNHNDFLATEKSYGDFILKLSFRMKGGPESNSGVQFRSVRVPPHEMSGYQADVGQNYWGCLYDESRRNQVLVPASADAKAAIHQDGWNHYVIRATGDHITLTLNGVTSVDYRETDPNIAHSGHIGLQMHAGGPMEMQFKDLYIQELPTPAVDPATTRH